MTRHTISSKNNFINKNNSGQGALEYLLLIGGAVLVGTIVLLLAIGSTSSTEGIINNNLTTYDTALANAANLGGTGGGGGPPSNPPVVSLNASGGDTVVSLSWNVSSNFEAGTFTYHIKGGASGSMSGVTNQTTFNSFSGFYDQTVSVSSSGNAPQATGLTNGTAYDFKMLACNSAGCTVSSTASATPTSVGSAPTFSTPFSVQQFGTTFDTMIANWALTGSPNIVSACVSATPLSGITATTDAQFQTQCSAASGLPVTGYAASGPTQFASVPNTTLHFRLFGQNAFGGVLSPEVTINTLSMASFFSFDWDTMITPLVAGSLPIQPNNISLAWTFSNTSATGDLVVSSITPTYNQAVNLTTFKMVTPSHSENSVTGTYTSGNPIATTFTIEGGSYGTSTSSNISFSGPIHTNGATQKYRFTFSDGSFYDTPTLNVISLAESSTGTKAAITCNGISAPGAATAINLGKDYTTANADGSYSTNWNFAPIADGSKIIFASLELMQTLSGGTVIGTDPYYVETLPSGIPTCNGSVITTNDTADTPGVSSNVGTSIIINPSSAPANGTVYQLNFESLLPSVAGPDDFAFIITGKDYGSPATATYRKFGTVYNATPANRPAFYIGYETP